MGASLSELNGFAPARELSDLTVVDAQMASLQGVNHATVVGDHNDSSFGGDDRLLDLLDEIDGEVVRRLVQK